MFILEENVIAIEGLPSIFRVSSHVCCNNQYSWTITDVNECELAIPPCGNGATCKNSEGDYECVCTEFWKGKDCKDGRYIYCTPGREI